MCTKLPSCVVDSKRGCRNQCKCVVQSAMYCSMFVCQYEDQCEYE